MDAFLVYGYSTSSTCLKRAEIDEKILKDRKTFLLFMGRIKLKKLPIAIIFILNLSGDPKPVNAVGLSATNSIHQLYLPSSTGIGQTLVQNPVCTRKINKIIFKNQEKEIDLFDIVIAKNVRNNKIQNNALLEVRGGDYTILHTIVLTLFLSYMYYCNSASFFGPTVPAVNKVDLSSFWGNLAGFPKPNKYGGFSERQYPFSENYWKGLQMSSAAPDQNGFFLNEQDVSAILADRYNGRLMIGENGLYITKEQAFRKLYHSTGFGIKPKMYGMDQKEIQKISDRGGLIAYIRRGSALPPEQYITDYMHEIKNFCSLPGTTVEMNGYHAGITGLRPAVIYHDKKSSKFACFDKETGALINCGKNTSKNFWDQLGEIKTIGSLSWLKEIKNNDNK